MARKEITMQTITVTMELSTNEIRNNSWGSAPETIKRLTNSELESLLDFIAELYEGEIPSRTAINDFFWFEDDVIEEAIGRKIIWEEDFAPEEDELELYRKASLCYEDMMDMLSDTDIDLFKADKQLLVEEYISSKNGFDEYITEHPFQIMHLMIKIFKERW